MSDVQTAPAPFKDVSERSATANQGGDSWNGSAARNIWGKPPVGSQSADAPQATQTGTDTQSTNPQSDVNAVSSTQTQKPADAANDQGHQRLNSKDQANQQTDSAASTNDSSQPPQKQAPAEGPQMPAELPPITIINSQENGATKPLYQVGVAENVISREAPKVADNHGPVNPELRAFCQQPIPSLQPPAGLAEAQRDLQNTTGVQAIVLGAEIGVVQGVYGLGNSLISLGNAVVSPPAKLGNFLATTITNPELANADAANCGTDTGTALVTGTKAVLAADAYLDAVSRAEWKGDFLKVPRDAVGLTLKAADAFSKLSDGQKSEAVTETAVALGAPLAAGRAVGFVAEMQQKMAAFLQKADAVADSFRMGPPGAGTGGGELVPALAGGTDATGALDASSNKQAGDQVLKMAGAASGNSLTMGERLAAITGKSAADMEQRLAELKAADPSGNRLLEINAIVKACESTANFKPSADVLFSSITTDQLSAYRQLIEEMPNIRNIDDIDTRAMKALEQGVTSKLRNMETAVKSGDPQEIDDAVQQVKQERDWLRMTEEGDQPGEMKPRRELPKGTHLYTLDQLKDEFATNPTRERLFQGLVKVLEELKEAGCKRVYLGGSFCSGKINPGDFDLTWDPEGVDMTKLDPVLTGPTWATTRERKAQYLGDIFIRKPALTGHDHVQEWQFDARSNVEKGVIQLNLEDMAL